MSYDARSIASFRSQVWKYWKKHGRHDLAWRKTTNPYRILVSEVMLQQTQVARVSEKYREFLKAFPTIKALAEAPLSAVLRVWSGMGYNRRAKYVRDAAKIIVEKYNGRVPHGRKELEELSGVGAYTAGAVRVFAFNESDTLIETNIRAAFIHHFYSSVLQKTAIADSQILPIAAAAAQGQNPRTWHWALMDYGVHVKRLHKNPARKSAHYVRQSRFEGSLRQVRGAILKALAQGHRVQSVPFDAERIKSALAGLARDGLITKQKGKWTI